ncbi:hypothetical protein INT45_006104 [Circinella minor]|uniref:Uncharacterized protein n=1 Tax=Circinella minor TaxID=1195481 RepID=A0A8H7VNR3_9FUNG|nr:hypothetical protein INT45_006104 [Circinella minor]
MAAMIQQNPVALRATSPSPQQQQQKPGQKSKDNNNNNSNSNSSKNDDNQKDAWTYPQAMAPMATPPADWPQGHTQSVANNNPYYYYPQQQQHHYDNKHQRSNTPHRPSPRQRTPSNNASVTSHPPIQIQKSSSTPIPSSNNYNRSSMLLKQQQQQHYAQGRREKHKKQQQQQKQSTYPPQERPPSLSSTASSVPSPAPSLEDSGRRSSVTSVSSGTFSIRSEMSINTKVSLSKRLRKVFSMSHLRSKDNLSMYSVNSGSNTSLATVQESGGPAPSSSPSTPPSRRRSFASLSGLFQKHTATEPSSPTAGGTAAGARMSPSSSGDLRKMAKNQRNDRSSRPVLRVDTTPEEATKRNIRGRSPSSTAPDSPSSTRSSTVRPAQQHVPRFMGNTSDSLPSPTPSSSSTSSNRMPVEDGSSDMAPPRSIGLHYGLPLHGSPRLRPTAASSSTSSLNTMTNTSSTPDQSRRLQFCPTIQVHETFTASEYDRRCDTNATCQKLTPLLAMKIKQELNEFKLTDMEVHVDSRQYTHFFL